MALVDYSGSEDSDIDEPAKASAPVIGKAGSNKPAFQKLVDQNEPSRVRVNLSNLTKPAANDGPDMLEPPSKRVKTESTGLGGFNSFLPAPKRSAGVDGAHRGIGRGVALKTGAAPGFTRDSLPAPQTGAGEETNDEGVRHETALATVNLSIPDEGNDSGSTIPIPPIKKKAMFKPLSVTRKPQKKKVVPIEDSEKTKATKSKNSESPHAKPRVPLFAVGDTSRDGAAFTGSTGTYEPIVYQSHDDISTPPTIPQIVPEDSLTTDISGSIADSSSTTHHPDSLTDIASDLNLSASARRQLLGRHHNSKLDKGLGSSSAIKITNFNTDEEYAANEILRQSGETVQHNPVRGIAPGKHSLKQLVNAATTQKDALEEHFAAGRRNRGEAGAKYGW